MGGKDLSALHLHNVSHAYFGRKILDGIHLEIGASEIVALVGPSGCGKSTLANVAAGIADLQAGRIERNYARHAVVFQDPCLLPWATAAANIKYGLALARTPHLEKKKLAERAAIQVNLEAQDLKKYPVELSGGMKQRVAIARAVAVQPNFIFFDEPFSALDVALRRRMQDLIIQIRCERTFSGLFITHDLHEAARISDRIVVLHAKGMGLVGERRPPGLPQDRTDWDVMRWVQSALEMDPVFSHIYDVDERAVE